MSNSKMMTSSTNPFEQFGWMKQQLSELEREVLKKFAGEDTGHRLWKMLCSKNVAKSFFKYSSISGLAEQIFPKLESAKDNAMERMAIIGTEFPNEEFLRWLKNTDIALTKNAAIASEFRMLRQYYFRNRDLYMAMKSVNLALAFMPSGSDQMPELYIERAAIHYEKKDWKSAVEDINLALEYELPQKLRTQLIPIQMECHGRTIPLNNSDNAENARRKAYSNAKLFNICGEPNAELPAAASCLSIVSNAEKDRIIVTNQDLDTGITIMVEDPYICLLTEQLNWEFTHCGSCFKFSRNLKPCPNCVFVSYCNEACRVKDYRNSHKFECPCLSYMHALGLQRHMQSSFKIICRAGPKNLYKIFTKDEGCNLPNEISESDAYKQIYNLTQHRNGEKNTTAGPVSFAAFTIAKLFEEKSGFFNDTSPEEKKSFLCFVATAIERHSYAVKYNSFQIWKDRSDFKPERVSKRKSGKKRIPSLVGVFAASNLIGHSCDPNVVGVHLNDGRSAFYTCRKIKAGEEITIKYGCDYRKHTLSQRIQFCATYRFTCTCMACVYNWPTLKILEGLNRTNLCLLCRENYTYLEHAENRKWGLVRYTDKDASTCPHCYSEFITSELDAQFLKWNDKLEEAKCCLKMKRPLAAIPLILECIDRFQTNLESPSLALRWQTLKAICRSL